MDYRWGEKNDLPRIIELLDLVRGDKRDLIADQFLVAVDNGRTVGCVRIVEKQAFNELVSLGVLPDYRGKGVGSTLVKKLLELKPQRPVYLLSFVELKKYYNLLGFKIVDSHLLPPFLREEFERIFSKLSVLGKEIIPMKLS